MKGIIYFLKFSIITCLLSIPLLRLNGQEIVGNESLALEYFNEGNYEKALPLFTVLYQKSPGNAMYNYYYGVCLLKNNHYETATKEALLNAVVNKTPSNVNFYLGNYFQALNNFGEALDFYARYKGSSEERRKLEFDRYLDLCRRKINPFIVKTNRETVFQDSIIKPAPQPDVKNFPIPEALKSEWFNFQINSQLTYHKIDDFKSEAARILFTRAWLASGRNDSIVTATEILRKAHQGTNNVSTRLALVDRIVAAEQQSYQLLRDREKYFEQARVKESGYWDKADPEALSRFIVENTKREKAHDSIFIAKNQQAEKERQEREDQVREKPVKISVSEPITEEADAKKSSKNIEFKIQIGSFKNGKITPTFKALHNKLSKLRKIEDYMDDKQYQIFTVGNFDNYQDANTLKNQLKLEGVKGAFVVAYKDGIKVPVTSIVLSKPGK